MTNNFTFSVNQREIYLDQMLWLEGVHYNIGAVVTVLGYLDIALLEEVENILHRTQLALRLRVNGINNQTIAEYKKKKIPVIDFSSYTDSELRANEYIKKDFCQPWLLEENTFLYKLELVIINPHKQILYAKYHHIITDGWGTSLYFSKFIDGYNKIKRGKFSPIETDTSFFQHLEEEAAYLKSMRFESDRKYWRKRLKNIVPRIFPKIKKRQLEGNRQAICIPRQQYDRVNTLCQDIKCSLFHFTIALLGIYLRDKYKKKDLVMGLSLLNRNKIVYKQTIGLFVSTLLFRIEIEATETLVQLIEKIKKLLREDYRHQRFPVGEIKRELPELQDSNLYEVYLSYEKHDYSIDFDNTKTTCVPLYSGQQRVPLIVYIREFDPQSDVKIDFDYNVSYLNAETVASLAKHVQNLFKKADTIWNKAISDLSDREVSAEVAVEEVTVEGGTETLISAFANSVNKFPDRLAVKFKKKSLTYSELDLKSDRIAQYLRQKLIGTGQRVGLCLDRSENIIVTILGVLKAGAAYVPIDPNYPETRIQFVLEDSDMSLLLTEEAVRDRLMASKTEIVTIQSLENWVPTEINKPEIDWCLPESPAYVIYTSGSTGTPKGCVVTHANVMRLMRSTEQWFGFKETDIWTLFHSFAFDFSVWEIWGALVYGGQVSIVPFWLSRSPESFHEFIAFEKVTVLNQTPSAFYQFMRADEASVDELALRYVIFGGEALDLQSLAGWFERHGDRQPCLINMYGITETTVHVTYRPIASSDLSSNSGSVIGKSIPDLRVYLLDEQLTQVPPGETGEIYVSGAGVTLGYLNRPSLTAERFIPNPFGSGRLYRSGDLARSLPNGDLEYLGRLDSQVKIHGFRIELGEIQSTLTAHPQIAEALVTIYEEELEEKRLVAYYVGIDPLPTSQDLRRYLKSRLPDYLVPAGYVSLEKFPLTVHGKIDRKQLPPPNWNLMRQEADRIGPRNLEETTLCAIFCEVLGLEKLGIDDNFFEVGGDSILAMQVVAKAKTQAFALSIRDIYEMPTVRELVTKKKELPLAPFQTQDLLSPQDRSRLPANAESAYPLCSLQAGMLYESERYPNEAIFHNIFTWDLRVSYDELAWKQAIADIFSFYPALRSGFEWSGYSEPLQIVSREVPIPFTICDLRGEGDAQTKFKTWIELEKNSAFDVRHPPLLRIFLHRMEEKKLSLSFSFHHAILDGWSVASLMTDLLQRYIGYAENTSFKKKNYLIQEQSYCEFIASERETIAKITAREFWQAKLDDLELSAIPRLLHNDNKSARQITRWGITLDTEVTATLRQYAKGQGISLRTIFLTAHLRVLSFITGMREVVTGNVVHGRPETLGSQEMLGVFVNTLPLRFKLLPEYTWEQLIKAVWQEEITNLPYRNFPLAALQQLLNKRPLFDVAFNYVHFHIYEELLDLPQIEVLDVRIFEETDFSFLVEFCLVPGSMDVQLNLTYDANQFDRALVEQYGEYYLRTLAAMARDPQAQYLSQPLMSSSTQENWMQAANVNAVEYPSDKTLNTAFADSVRRYGGKIALTFEDVHLSFAELDVRANCLARYLTDKGVGREVFVGVSLSRSDKLVVTILAILKAGGAYVPIDPNSPKNRLETIVRDSGIMLLITEESAGPSRLNDLSVDAEIIVLEDIAGELARIDGTTVCNVNVLPEQAAYVIYTSGSTGIPKGCVVTHANAMRLFQATDGWFEFDSNDVWTLFHSYAFDFSVWEIWGSLLYGGRVVVVPHSIARSPGDFVELLFREKVTILNQTPSAFKQLIRAEGERKHELALRYVIFGGEALEPDSLKPWYDRHDDRSPLLVNMYGITETTVHVTYQPLSAACLARGSIIGEPIRDLQLYLLDENLEPVPVGTPGELYVGGGGVTRGYLNRPRLMAERFIPDPFGQKLGRRLYRTGDLARRLLDGSLEYLGRSDQQVKIRGFRIELGEITAAIRSHPLVRDGLAIAYKEEGGTDAIVAYVVSSEADLQGTLRDYLKAKLPDYMVPSVLITIDSIPITVNGKVDRAKLPMPDRHREVKQYVAPKNDREATICQIMASLLNLERVGATEDFFDLGGHSLLLTKLVTSLRETYKIAELPLPDFFDHRTPVDMAELIAKYQEHTAPAAKTGITKSRRNRRSVQLSEDGTVIDSKGENEQ